MPTAANCRVVPGAMEPLDGEIVMETRAGEVTVRDALPLTPEDVALMVVEPTAWLVAKPELEMVAALVLEELQVTELVRSLLLPSVKVPNAVNWAVVPKGMDVAEDETASEAKAAAVTLRVVLPLMPEYEAVMVVEPAVFVVAMPVFETVAALVFDELQVADLVRSLLLPSLYLPVAVNCWPSPAATEGVPGVT